MTILDEIVKYKREYLEERKKQLTIAEFENMESFAENRYSLRETLRERSQSGIIAEFKRQSPSKGVINDKADVADVTSSYDRNGATGISVLTDRKYFGGSEDDLMTARKATHVPLLRKEFIIDEFQIYEARAFGGDVILLIASCLSKGEVLRLTKKAKELELEVLLEIHNEKELAHLNDQVDFVGINNRDLKTFKVDIDQSIRLAEKIPGQFFRIAESGLHSVDTIRLLKEHGFNGFLMGEAFMKEQDPGYAFEKFIKTLTD
jgi:indole-3-glycerol phosphate synthase